MHHYPQQKLSKFAFLHKKTTTPPAIRVLDEEKSSHRSPSELTGHAERKDARDEEQQPHAPLLYVQHLRPPPSGSSAATI
jgi:hypothetical protein